MRIILKIRSEELDGDMIGSGVAIDVLKSMLDRPLSDDREAIESGMCVAITSFLIELFARIETSRGVPFLQLDNFNTAVDKTARYFAEQIENAAALYLSEIFVDGEQETVRAPEAPPDWNDLFRFLAEQQGDIPDAP